MPFNRVVLNTGTSSVEMTPDAFMGMPLHDRIRYILAGGVDFFDGAAKINRAAALRALRGAP